MKFPFYNFITMKWASLIEIGVAFSRDNYERYLESRRDATEREVVAEIRLHYHKAVNRGHDRVILLKTSQHHRSFGEEKMIKETYAKMPDKTLV